ncbi:MAG TPA: HAD family phosphatase [Steroidobacteraceae bacterium]|nr:HAD family phosphatase [Steroidobacteraceae bacterium]
MSDTRLPALIFDCDGVLIDSEYLASRVETEVARDLGLTLGVEEAHDLFLGKTVEGVLEAIAARAGQRPSVAFVYNWAFATAHAFLRELKAVDGVGVAVETLRRRGHRMAVASQSPLARVRLSLHVAGLAGQFGEHIYVTSMVPRPKPAPDIYLLAAAKLGAAPADCIVIEDSPAGAAAALGAGMQVVGFAPGKTADAMRASGARVIRSMDELIAAIGT